MVDTVPNDVLPGVLSNSRLAVVLSGATEVVPQSRSLPSETDRPASPLYRPCRVMAMNV